MFVDKTERACLSSVSVTFECQHGFLHRIILCRMKKMTHFYLTLSVKKVENLSFSSCRFLYALSKAFASRLTGASDNPLLDYLPRHIRQSHIESLMLHA